MRWLLALLAVHTAVNARLLRTTPTTPPGQLVSVLLPVRNEQARVAACLVGVLAQQGIQEVLVLDDGSTDHTADVVAGFTDARLRLLAGTPLPPGWVGKPHACQQLADAADPRSEVLVFLDADVVLAPGGLAAAVGCLDRSGLDLISPYPRQEAPGATRLVQPLLQWSWLTFLPLRLAERSPRPSLSAANGQLLLVRRDAYRRAGGHAAVRNEVVEDLAVLRAVKRAGGRGGVVDGTAVATTTMYRSWAELADGYAKSLHTTPPFLPVLLVGLYVAPLLGRHRRSAYALGVLGRVISARRTGGCVVDAFAHPLSVLCYAGLDVRSRLLHRRDALTWKGRSL